MEKVLMELDEHVGDRGGDNNTVGNLVKRIKKELQKLERILNGDDVTSESDSDCMAKPAIPHGPITDDCDGERIDEGRTAKEVLFLSDSHFKHHTSVNAHLRDMHSEDKYRFVSHSGCRTEQMKTTVGNIKGRYTEIVICIGSNDISPRNSEPDMKTISENIEHIISSALQHTSKVLLVEPPPTLNPLAEIRQRHTKLTRILLDLARSNDKVVFVPISRIIFTSRNTIRRHLYADATHLGPDGFRRVFNCVLYAMDKAPIPRPDNVPRPYHLAHQQQHEPGHGAPPTQQQHYTHHGHASYHQQPNYNLNNFPHLPPAQQFPPAQQQQIPLTQQIPMVKPPQHAPQPTLNPSLHAPHPTLVHLPAPHQTLVPLPAPQVTETERYREIADIVMTVMKSMGVVAAPS
jgi:hypothetical protein